VWGDLVERFHYKGSKMGAGVGKGELRIGADHVVKVEYIEIDRTRSISRTDDGATLVLLVRLKAGEEFLGSA
jgi:hypothetical protein